MSSPTPIAPTLARLTQRLLDWQPHNHGLGVRLVVAVTITLLAAWLRMSLAPAESGGRFVTFALAVAISALYGGFAAGMVSTLLGMLMVSFFLLEPYGSLAFSNKSEAFWLNFWHFMTQLVVVSAITMMQRRNLRLQQASKEAQTNQEQFLATFEHAASGISHVALDGRLLRVNQTFCDLVGYTDAELRQRSFQNITHPDDLAPDIAMIEQTLSGQRSNYSLEKRYRHKDGRLVWAQLTVALIRKPDGTPHYFVSVVQDITAQKATEEALRTSQNLLRQAQEVARFSAWQADLTNHTFRNLYGTTAMLGLIEQEHDGVNLLNLTHPDDRAGVLKAWYSAIHTHQTYHHEYRVMIQGEERWHSVRAIFEYDGSGRPVHALGVTRDITEEKIAQMEVQRLNASLEQRIRDRTLALQDAYNELESYSYAVAHDLRSPLRIINGFAQALREDNPALDSASQDNLARIMGASKKMGELIDGLLRLSQFARGDVHRTPVDLSIIAKGIADDLSSTDPERQVVWEIAPDLKAQADPTLMEALMQNLLHNAWKYSSALPEAHIRVFSQLNAGVTEYHVSDNGAGFDMARSDKLFQPFQRLHQPHEFAGLGIGLATARRIVQRHGGSLSAHSALGQGATFCFTLPAEAGSPGSQN